MIPLLQNDYYKYVQMFRGNYLKGATLFRSLLNDSTTREQMLESLPALSAIFTDFSKTEANRLCYDILIEKDYFEAARTLGASNRQLVFNVAIPHAMPSILSGMTQAMSSSCVAIMIAEMLGVKSGLGWYMNWSKSWASYDKMFAALFVICIIFTVVTKSLDAVKRYVLRWQIGAEK